MGNCCRGSSSRWRKGIKQGSGHVPRHSVRAAVLLWWVVSKKVIALSGHWASLKITALFRGSGQIRLRLIKDQIVELRSNRAASLFL